mmetsp:Transcript_4404/g.6415  ORF Transcript_4404/g.6415 Transcript_4404/m.6415 type:complete len:150 (-) Transcript_4404:655-1104(-)
MIDLGIGIIFLTNLGVVLFFALVVALLAAALPLIVMTLCLLLPGGILIATLFFLLTEASLAFYALRMILSAWLWAISLAKKVDFLTLLFGELVHWEIFPSQSFIEEGFTNLMERMSRYLAEMTGFDLDSFLGFSVVEAMEEDFWLHLVL